MLIRKVLIGLVLVMGLTATGLAEGHYLQDITVKLPRGTGVFINGKEIITAAHLIDPRVEGMWGIVIVNGEHEMIGRTVRVDREADLALLEIDHEPFDYPKLQFKLETEIDDEVLSVVNFGVFEDVFLRGRVSGYGYYGGDEFIVIDMTIIPGMSGACVFSEGKIIGIIRKIYGHQPMGDFVALIIPAKRIVKFLEE